MALIIQLRKRRHEPWGFRLVGGSEHGVPLTVVKVSPGSAAARGGLRVGDALLCVGGRGASRMTHDDAQHAVGKADCVLDLEVCRGRYDAILDDQEAVLEPYEPDYFAPQSEPTEVFLPIDPTPSAPEVRPQPDRSLTASPFVLPTKPYRPFSAEPITEVPPIEDPIILNPNYHDEFGATEDGYPLKTKFKLPISEQYDPDGTGKSKCGKVQNETLKEQTCVSESFEMKSEVMTEEETKFMEQMKLDIDLDKIEMTATSVVDESISKAVNVTEEIKNEMTFELQTSNVSKELKTSELLEMTEKCLKESVISKLDTTATSINEISNKSALNEKNLESNMEFNTFLAAVNEKSVKNIEQSGLTEEVLKSTMKLDSNEKTLNEGSVVSQTKQEIEETISKGTVKRLSANFGGESVMTKSVMKNVDSSLTEAVENKCKKVKQYETTTDNCSSVKSASTVQSNTIEKSQTSGKTSVKADSSSTKTSSTKQKVGERAFMIGLQTIPNIRGQIKSSYHYDLLLRTFFIHLTDVMVALSRFLLTEDVFSKQTTSEATETVEEKTASEQLNVVDERYGESQNIEANAEIESEIVLSQKSEQLEVDVAKEIVTKHKSGLEMSQLAAHKSEELTHKMEAVITEFQTKSGHDETVDNTETDQTSTVVEKISENKAELLTEESEKTQAQKIQKKTEYQSSVDSHTVQKEMLEQKLQTLETEQTLETTELKTESSIRDKKSKKDRQTYVAVVESHTYTNKDTVFEEHFSGASSLQSPEAATVKENTFFESNVQTKNDFSNTTNIESKELAIKTNEIENKSEEIISDKTLEKIDQCEINQETSVVLPRKLSLKEPINEDTQATVQIFKEIEEPIQTQYETETKIEQTAIKTFQSTEIASSQILQSSEINTTEATRETFIQKQDRNLTLDLNKTDLHKKVHKISPSGSSGSLPSTISTPTPMTVPPTPLTDEYIFRLECPMPPDRGTTPLPEESSPEKEIDHEDLTIVKKKLNPYIETTIERVVYDPPLPSPVDVSDVSPFALRGGVDVLKHAGQMTQEEILEIERKSSLLTSAIDETIKNIEEYKEQVAMATKEAPLSTQKNTEMLYKGFVTEAKTTVFSDAVDSFIQTKLNTETSASNRVKFDEKVAVIDSVVATETNETSNEVNGIKVSNINEFIHQEKSLQGYRPIVFNPEEKIEAEKNLPGFRSVQLSIENQAQQPRLATPRHVEVDGELLGSTQGFIGGLQETVMNEQVAKELGKPGISEEKIAEIMSGESEMLREAHVMGLSRVLSSHMNKPDDSSVDFNKLKPTIDKLKDSEVLKALNDELTKTKAEKKQDDRKWTTFLQKPQRKAPNAKFGYHGYLPQFDMTQEPYKVKIVKQPKPKVAPDFKPPEDFETGLLPWEERARNEPPPPPIEPEDPILIPEEAPEFLEAVDPLPESEVPDLEDTGIPLPPEKAEEIPEVAEIAEPAAEEEVQAEPEVEKEGEQEEEQKEEEEDEKMAEQLLSSVQNMVDPHAPLEQQLAQMRAQLAALAQLPGIIQQSLELVSSQLVNMAHQETTKVVETETTVETHEEVEVKTTEVIEESLQEEHATEITKATETESAVNGIPKIDQPDEINPEDVERVKRDQEIIMEQQRKIDKQRKELMDQMQTELESRQVKQHPTPRVGKPKPMFGPLVPQERPLVLPGGRKWRKPKDAYNEQFIAETLTAQAEIIKGKAKGVNFLKYEKPPISLDHLQHSEVYKLVHEPDARCLRRVDMLTPVIAECDYRERCRSQTPAADLKAQVAP